MINYFIFFLFFITQTTFTTYHSQFGQDKFLNDNFFKNKRNGVFVEIGAADGIGHSNSYFFEKTLNWRGICIEPVPNFFNRLVKNRKCICIQGCISNKTGTSNFLEITYPDGSINGWSGLVETYDSRHLKDLEDQHLSKGCKVKTINVNCYLLNDLLEKYKIYNVDYLSIDVEGAELSILSTINFKKFNFKIIGVENNYNDNNIREILTKNNFSFIGKCGVDDIFLKNK